MTRRRWVDVHELAIAESVVQTVLERTGQRPVVTLRMSIGRLSGVVLHAFEFCFEMAASGTPLAGCELQVEQPAGRLHCRTCGEDEQRDDMILLCGCGSADVDVVGGRELQVISVEVG